MHVPFGMNEQEWRCGDQPSRLESFSECFSTSSFDVSPYVGPFQVLLYTSKGIATARP